MLRARLYRGDLYQDFSPLSDGWILGRKSTITPLKNPFLKPVMYQCSDAIAFGVMEISWDFEEIVCSRSELVISRQQARKFILQGPEAKRKSLIQDVFCLLPGDSAHWQVSTAQLHIVNQTDLTPFEPSILAPNANVTGAFVQLIQNTIEPYLELSQQPVI